MVLDIRQLSNHNSEIQKGNGRRVGNPPVADFFTLFFLPREIDIAFTEGFDCFEAVLD